VVDSRAQLVAVEIGRRSGIAQQILRGVEGGMQIVNHPPASLQDGDRVRPL